MAMRLGSGISDQKKSNKKVRSGPLGRVLPFFIALFAIFLPHAALAQVQITEIMYDAPGSDEGHEWIEVTNTGADAVDIKKYKLSESGSNHILTAVSGGSLLGGGMSAIIASDAKKFAADWPRYSGILFDSSFSLSNSGEELVLKDASSTPVDTVSYQANDAADGTGGSLHRVGGNFSPAQANPGIYPGTLVAVVSVAKTAPMSSFPKTKSSAKKTVIPENTSLSQKATQSGSFATSTQDAARLAVGTGLASDLPAVEWIIGLAAVVILGVAGVYLVRNESGTTGPKSAATIADEFEIE